MNQETNSPVATQLEFSQAMADFKIMFPSTDTDVIEVVLRANQGAVDATIDQLLLMSTDNESLPCGREDPEKSLPPEYQNNLPTYHQAVTGTDAFEDNFSTENNPCQLNKLDSIGATGGGKNYQLESSMQDTTPLHRCYGWKPPLLGKLPSDFLRIAAPMGMRQGHAYTYPSHDNQHQPMMLSPKRLREKYMRNQEKMNNQSLANTPEMAQMLEDERIALMFQNQEFMAELRSNHEFMSTLDLEGICEEKVFDQPTNLKERKGVMVMEDTIFREKLKNMGKTSKQKFAKLANMFSRQRGAQKQLGHAPAPSNDNLLLNEEQLIAEDSDTEESGDAKHSTTKGHKYQLM